MSLNRNQKRNLAIVLTEQARAVVRDWDHLDKDTFTDANANVLRGISADEVQNCFGGWLRYLPNKPAADMLNTPEAEVAADNAQREESYYVDDQQDDSDEQDNEPVVSEYHHNDPNSSAFAWN